MSEQEHMQECLRKEIRALLISAKDGLSATQLEKEYLLLVGSPLPLRALGYRSTMELLLDMPDVVNLCPSRDGTIILRAIPDESTKGIASLVAKQRSNHKVRPSGSRFRASVCTGPGLQRRLTYRGRVPPILPAVVKSELRDLLALSPVLLADFEQTFTRRFGRPFQYAQYGFLSMFEVLSAASDVISVEQTRAGSLLMLKRSRLEERPRGWPVGKIFSQPFRMNQQGPCINYDPGAKARFSQPPSNMDTPRQNLNLDRTSRENGMETSRLSHAEKLNQLENTFKSVIAQIGPGGAVNPELKHKIKFVVSKFPDGLLISKLLGEFEMTFKEQLSPKSLGFLNVMELVGALSDILHVEFREGEQDLLVFDADRRPPPAVLADQKVEGKAQVSSSSQNLLSAAATKETPWHCSRKPTLEPEAKLCKKPNLVVKPLQLQEEANKAPPLEPASPIRDLPPDAVQDKHLCRLPPLETSTLVGVFVEYIVSPSQFYIRIYSPDSSKLLEDMMIEMRRCYSSQLVSDRYSMSECDIQPGRLCCVRISEDKWWYRVIIHRLVGKQEVEVFYPDFGNIGTVQKSSLCFLKCCYTKLPAQAIPCSLAWVRPVRERWTPKAIVQFQKLCGLKPLVGVVDEYVDGILNIFLCDTSSNEDIYFHHVLRTEGHAIVCRENIPSMGFRELNPLALYTKPSTRLEDAALTELSHQSHSSDDWGGTMYHWEYSWDFCQCPHSCAYSLTLICLGLVVCKQDTNGTKSLNPRTAMGQDVQKGPDFSLMKVGTGNALVAGPLKDEKEDIPDGMPCLESVTLGDDIWDEHWLPLQTKVGRGEATPGALTVSHLTRPPSPCPACEEVPQTHLDSRDSLDFSLPHLEEFYDSLSQSSPLEPSDLPHLPSALQPTMDPLSSSPSSIEAPSSEESSPKSPTEADAGSSHTIKLFKDQSQGAVDQLSLILSPEHQISHKLYLPQSTATAALGAAARLAMSRSLLHWFPSVKRTEA